MQTALRQSKVHRGKNNTEQTLFLRFLYIKFPAQIFDLYIQDSFCVLQLTTLLFNISEIQSSLNKELHDVRLRVESCEIQGSNNSLKIANVATQGSSNSLRIERNSEEIKLLEKKFTTELLRYNIKEEETISYVFSAPPRNRYFAGRTEEI